MKKIKNIILSLIMPRKMAKYRNMHFILALFIYVIGMFLAIGSQFMSSKRYVKNEMERTEFEVSLKSAGKLQMQKLAITDDENLSLDPSEESLSINTSLVLTKVKNEQEKLNFGFIYAEDLTKEALDEETNLTDEMKTSLNTTKSSLFKYFEAQQSNNDENWLLLLFTKEEVYYKKGLFINEYTSESTVNSYLEEIESECIISKNELLLPLSYLERLQNVDPLGFINRIYMVLFGEANSVFSSLVECTGFDKYVYSYFKQKGIYHKLINDQDGKYVDLTVVIDEALSTKNEYHFAYFDYEGYCKQKRKDNTTYILCVFGSERFFYLYDLGQTYEQGRYKTLDYSTSSIFETTDVDRVYYLPNALEELSYNMYGELDTTLWTAKVGKDDQFDVESYKSESELKKYIDLKSLDNVLPVDRHLANFHNALYTVHSRSYLYTDFMSGDFAVQHLYGELNVFLQKVNDTMIMIDAANYELIYGIMAFGIFIFFPLIMALIVWLMSRKLVMQRYRQYYAIGAITYGITGIISFIVGFIVPFDKFALILMFIQAWYFIFVTFRINTDPAYENEDVDPQTPSTPVLKEEFKKVSEHKSSQIG